MTGCHEHQSLLHPLRGPEPALTISERVSSGLLSMKHEEYWQYVLGQRQARDFLKRPSAKRVGQLPNLRRN
jgi:hypothetical protein